MWIAKAPNQEQKDLEDICYWSWNFNAIFVDLWHVLHTYYLITSGESPVAVDNSRHWNFSIKLITKEFMAILVEGYNRKCFVILDLKMMPFWFIPLSQWTIFAVRLQDSCVWKWEELLTNDKLKSGAYILFVIWTSIFSCSAINLLYSPWKS